MLRINPTLSFVSVNQFSKPTLENSKVLFGAMSEARKKKICSFIEIKIADPDWKRLFAQLEEWQNKARAAQGVMNQLASKEAALLRAIREAKTPDEKTKKNDEYVNSDVKKALAQAGPDWDRATNKLKEVGDELLKIEIRIAKQVGIRRPSEADRKEAGYFPIASVVTPAGSFSPISPENQDGVKRISLIKVKTRRRPSKPKA